MPVVCVQIPPAASHQASSPPLSSPIKSSSGKLTPRETSGSGNTKDSAVNGSAGPTSRHPDVKEDGSKFKERRAAAGTEVREAGIEQRL